MSALSRSSWLSATLVAVFLGACTEPVPPRKVTSVAVTPATLSLAKGTRGKVAATATFNDKSTEDVTTRATWTVSDAALGSVAAGEVTASGTGQGSVQAAVDGVSGQAALTVTAAELLSLEISPPAVGLAKGTTAQLVATGTFTDGTKQELSGEVTWTAGDGTLASVSAGGLVTALGTGSTTIRAEKSGISATATVLVSDAKLVSLALTPAQPQLAKGTRTNLVATGTFTDGTTQDLTSTAHWTSANAEVAAVSDEAGHRGEVRGAKEGSVEITANIGEITAKLTVQVTAAELESLAIDPPALALAKGTKGAFHLVGTFSDASTQDLTEDATWASDAPGLAAVSPAAGTRGAVEALDVGRAQVTADFGGKQAKAAVEVTAATLVSLAIDPPAPALAKGTTLALSATGIFSDGSTQNLTSAVTWSASDEDVVHVSNAAGTSGLATALAEGEAEVTAQLGSVTAKAALQVSEATLASIVVSPGALALPRGTDATLVATGVFSDGSRQELSDQVTWTSADEAVATVSNAAGEAGEILARAEGATTITATRGSVHGEAAVAVSSAQLVSLAISPASTTVPVGRTIALTATATYSDGSTRNVTSAATWSSADEALATVSNADGSVGTVTGHAAGTVNVEAELGGAHALAQVEVTAAELVSIAITPQPAALAKGTTLPLTATATWSDGHTSDVTAEATWSSSDAAIAAVSTGDEARGVVSGLAAGSATIRAQIGSISASAPVTVTSARLTGLAISPSTVTLAKGTSRALTLTGTFSDGTHQNVTSLAAWSSSGNAVSVSNADGSNGLATAQAAGAATVTASFGGLSATAQVTVSAAELVSLAIAPANLTLAQGTTFDLVATGTFTDGSSQDLTATVAWTSDDAAVAAVSMADGTHGRVSGAGRGTTTVRAKSGTIEATARITVSAGVLDRIEITANAGTFAKGTTQPLVATGVFTDGSTQNLTSTVTWSSSDEQVVAVSNAAGQNGLASAIGTGKATISAAFAGKSASLELTASQATLVSIGLTPAAPVLAKGTSKQLVATGVYSDKTTLDLTRQVTWTTSDAAIAPVSTASGSEGTVTAAGEGTATITAQLGSVKGAATATVTAATLASIGVTPTSPTMAAGTKLSLVATGTFSDGTKQDLSSLATWSSAAPAVVDVSNAAGTKGLASALGAGSAVVKAAVGGVEGSTTVTVSSAVLQAIALAPAAPSIAKGTTKQLAAMGLYSDGSSTDLTQLVSWTTDDPTIATASNAASTRGLLRGTGVGATRVLATIGSITGAANVTVTPAVLDGIEVTPTTPSLPKGVVRAFTATGIYTDGTKQDLTTTATWTTSDAAVADVSNAAGTNGSVTALKIGSATVTASHGTFSAGTLVTVTPAALVKISLSPAAPKLAKGRSLALTANGEYTDGSKAVVTSDATWSSSDLAIAEVSSAAGSEGKVTGKGVGTAQITATVGSVTGSTTFEVTAAELVSLAITPAASNVPLGATKQLTATGIFTDDSHQDLTTAVTWASTANLDVSNAAGSNGLATGLALGAGSVTATLAGVSASTALDVTAAVVKSISIAPSPISAPKGTKLALQATGIYTDGTSQDLTKTATWGTSDSNVATVSNAAGSEGVLTAITGGTATISATSGSVKGTATATVTTPVLDHVEVAPGSATVPKGRTIALQATAVYRDGTRIDVTDTAVWSAPDPTIADITSAGVAKAVDYGAAYVQAKFGGLSGICTISVSSAELDSLTITAPMTSIAKGTTVQLKATGTYSDGSTTDHTNDVTWQPADPAIASVSNASGSQGLAKGLAVGNTTITASFAGVTSAPFSLSVTTAFLSSIAVSPASASIAKGTVQAFMATGTYSDGSTADITTAVTWNVMPQAVASIVTTGTGAGAATGLSAGTASVWANLSGVTSAFVGLTVTPATLVSIDITPSSFSLVPGGTKALTATGTYTDGSKQDVTTQATWSSNSNGVASVSNATGSVGVVTAQATGTAKITAAIGSIVSSAATATVGSASCRTVAINELMTGISGNAGAEFVELKNRCGNDVDLSGWKLVYRSASGTTDVAMLTFNAGTTLTASGLVLVSSSAFTTAFPAYTVLQTWSGSTSLSATGGGVQLRDSSGTAIDSVGWGSAVNAFVETAAATAPTDAASPGKTIIRTPDGSDSDSNAADFKVTTKPTPGSSNVLQ